MKITKERWHDAQEFEYKEWISDPETIKLEEQEVQNKYSKLLKKIAVEYKLKSSDNILDVGCNVTCVCKFFGIGNLYGIDPLADKIDHFKSIKNVNIKAGVGEEIPFKDNFFDVVVCRNVIDHTYLPEKVISEINRVSKADSLFVLTCYVYNPFIFLLRNLAEKISRLRNVGHPHTYTENSLINLVKKYYRVKEVILVNQGKSPWDNGKEDVKLDGVTKLHKIIAWVNTNVFRYDYFSKEICLVLKSKKTS